MSTREELLAEAAALTDAAEHVDNLAYQNVTKSVGYRHSGQNGQAGLVEAKSKLAAALEQIAPRLRDPKAGIVSAIGQAAKAAAESLPEDEASRVWQVAGKAAELPGYRDIEGYLGTLANRYDERAGGVGPAVRGMLQAARSALEAGNPAYKQRLRAIHDGWVALDRTRPHEHKKHPGHFIFGHSR